MSPRNNDITPTRPIASSTDFFAASSADDETRLHVTREGGDENGDEDERDEERVQH